MTHCRHRVADALCGRSGVKRESGFSIIELMIVLVIASILVATAGPGFMNLLGNNRTISEVYALRATLNNARTEALARRAPVVVCPTTDGLACADSSDWSTGYMVFVDTDNDNAADSSDPDEEIIQFETGPRPVDLAFSNGANRVRFGAQGSALGFEGTFTFCDDRGDEHARGLIINPVGNLSAATDTDDPEDLIVNDAGGDNVVCG
jgi:type IV fimbrial biogenesis protein FimT